MGEIMDTNDFLGVKLNSLSSIDKNILILSYRWIIYTDFTLFNALLLKPNRLGGFPSGIL